MFVVRDASLRLTGHEKTEQSVQQQQGNMPARIGTGCFLIEIMTRRQRALVHSFVHWTTQVSCVAHTPVHVHVQLSAHVEANTIRAEIRITLCRTVTPATTIGGLMMLGCECVAGGTHVVVVVVVKLSATLLLLLYICCVRSCC